jgi:glycosyltransferase involved in cell wall biosynthesis
VFTSFKFPIVSILTAAYNADAALLLEAYNSIDAAVGSLTWEWIIQFDGDAIALDEKITSDKRVKLSANGRHCGAAVTRNIALTRCCGKFVQNLDADDILLPTAIVDLSAALFAHHDSVLAFGRHLELMTDGTTNIYPSVLSPGVVPAGLVFEKWMNCTFLPIHPAGILWRKDVILAYGGWAALPAGEDTALLVAATQHHTCVFIDRQTFVYRRHADQFSHSQGFIEGNDYKRAFIEQRARVVAKSGAQWEYLD